MGELSEVEGGDERSKLRNSLIVFLKSSLIPVPYHTMDLSYNAVAASEYSSISSIDIISTSFRHVADLEYNQNVPNRWPNINRSVIPVPYSPYQQQNSASSRTRRTTGQRSVDLKVEL